MAYEYDVFLSYPGDDDIAAWIRDYFAPRLHAALREDTLATCNMPMGRIFFDRVETGQAMARTRRFAEGIVPGDNWQESLKRAMRVSRCMVALCSPTYFHSEWCHLELSTFLARQGRARAPIVTPVSLVPKEKLPQTYLAGFQVYELHQYVVDGPSFYGSRLFPEFVERIKQLSDFVARSICGAPEFDIWDVAPPESPLPPPPPVRVGRF